MGTSNYSDEFKSDPVHQITVRGHPVRKVSRCLAVGTYSLYKWPKQFGEPVTKLGVHQTRIYTWERQAPAGMSGVFSGKATEKEGEIEKLHARIGQFVMECDFLAKASGR